MRKTARIVAPASPGRPAAEPAAETADAVTATDSKDAPPVRMYLVGGGRVDVDEVSEEADGYWYRRGSIMTLIERARVERIERGPIKQASASPEGDKGATNWSLADATRVEQFFLNRFGRPLPITAAGQSALHTRWGYDHSKGLDVGLHPDSQEGRALTAFLRDAGIPFLSFRRAVPGVATGPHIHIGRPSPGLR